MERREPTDRRRMCARPACRVPAVATFNFDGLRRVVWVGPLDRDTGRSAGDLCAEHADRLVAPRHWELHDLRDPAPARPDPAPGPVAARARPLAPVASIQRQSLLMPAPITRNPAPRAASTPLLARAFRAAAGG